VHSLTEVTVSEVGLGGCLLRFIFSKPFFFGSPEFLWLSTGKPLCQALCTAPGA
jgi:hypothetical protein